MKTHRCHHENERTGRARGAILIKTFEKRQKGERKRREHEKREETNSRRTAVGERCPIHQARYLMAEHAHAWRAINQVSATELGPGSLQTRIWARVGEGRGEGGEDTPPPPRNVLRKFHVCFVAEEKLNALLQHCSPELSSGRQVDAAPENSSTKEALAEDLSFCFFFAIS